VYSAPLVEYPNKLFAAKLIPEAYLEENVEEQIEFSRDVNCLSLIVHENLVRCVGVTKLYYTGVDYTAIMMELMSTDLHNLLYL
jgi:hypothetical protein